MRDHLIFKRDGFEDGYNVYWGTPENMLLLGDIHEDKEAWSWGRWFASGRHYERRKGGVNQSQEKWLGHCRREDAGMALALRCALEIERDMGSVSLARLADLAVPDHACGGDVMKRMDLFWGAVSYETDQFADDRR